MRGRLENEGMCTQSEYRDMSASRIRSICLWAQDVGEVLGQEDIPFLEDKESISNSMVRTKSILTLDNKETWV